MTDSKAANAMKMKKNSELPEKICPVCNRPFTWRKKWERVWDEVTYCSQKCRRNKSTVAKDA